MITSSISELDMIKSGIRLRLCFDRRSTFKEEAVVEDVLAISVKLGTF